MEHQHVGLLEHLRALDALRTEQEVGGDRAAGATSAITSGSSS